MSNLLQLFSIRQVWSSTPDGVVRLAENQPALDHDRNFQDQGLHVLPSIRLKTQSMHTLISKAPNVSPATLLTPHPTPQQGCGRKDISNCQFLSLSHILRN